MNDFILKAENIKKRFQTTRQNTLDVLKGISIDIPTNKISVIVGASGAGKSTLLHILSGLDKPDEGSVFFNGNNILNMGNEKSAKFRNANMGFVFQFHHLLPEFTALENVSIPQLINGTSRSKAEKRGRELLIKLGIGERLTHKPSELSGGEQQRVAVARALANDPSIIFADEPSGNLDTENSEMLHNTFVELKENYGKTLIIVTHNHDLIKLADNVFEIKDGRLIT
jgi:ABC-type antimicrobial peptide transport system, ATPase component